MKKTIYLFIATLLWSCYGLNHTQNNPPELIFETDSLLANGTSQILITARTKNEFAAQQTIVFTTSGGQLYEVPITSSSVGAAKIVLFPNSNESKVILKSTLIPDDKVIITSGINGMLSNKNIKFTRSCPNDVNAILNKQDLSIGNQDTGQIIFSFLRSDGTNVSQNTRVDLTITPDSVASISPTIFSDSSGKATAEIKPLKKGKATITMIIQNCKSNVTVKPSSLLLNIKD